MMSHVLVLGTGVALLPRVVAIKGKPLGGIIAQRVLTVHSLEDKHLARLISCTFTPEHLLYAQPILHTVKKKCERVQVP